MNDNVSAERLRSQSGIGILFTKTASAREFQPLATRDVRHVLYFFMVDYIGYTPT